jgi:hypothetical protein
MATAGTRTGETVPSAIPFDARQQPVLGRAPITAPREHTAADNDVEQMARLDGIDAVRRLVYRHNAKTVMHWLRYVAAENGESL